ncbi:hypothetical protein BV25DRAFT_1911053 [Artomyces pyxidatus]|uniref:Uncharacterized protein n=1 Tax=Artomyces pyxidatus TaxID=48021 RepID=A0ACB8THU1_9AGAM|nr:hypothetical protein BV25DRAFT_1911053 [Artomyces pyxidatus]
MAAYNVDYILMLNNYLQATGEAPYLIWAYDQEGPQHQVIHRAIARLGNTVWGEGRAPSRSVARQMAAHMFLFNRGQVQG